MGNFQTLCMLGNFSCFCGRLLFFFSNSSFSNNSFRNPLKVSNGLDPDQDRRFVGSDLGPNCLQRLSAAYGSRQSVKMVARANFFFLVRIFFVRMFVRQIFKLRIYER